MRLFTLLLIYLAVVFACTTPSSVKSPMVFSDKIRDAHIMSSIFESADALRYNQSYEDAILAYQTLLSDTTFLDIDSLYIFNQIAYCYLMINDDSKAKPWISKADRVLKGKDSNSSIYAHHWTDFYFAKGRLYYLAFAFDSSRYYTHKSLSSYHQLGYGEHLKVAQCMNLLALLHFENNLLTDSCSYYSLQANDIFQNNSELFAYSWECDFALAATSLLNRAHERGELYCRRAIDKIEALSIENPLFLARCWSMLGRMIKKQGDLLKNKDEKKRASLYAEADTICFPRAISLAKKTSSLRIQEFYRDWIIHATRFDDSSKFFSYLSALDSVLVYQEDIYAKRNRLLGYYYFTGGEVDSALYYYHKLIGEHKNGKLEVHLENEAHFVLRTLYRQLGEYDKAIFYTTSRIKTYDCCPSNADFYNFNLLKQLDIFHNFCVLKYGDIGSILFEKYLTHPKIETLILANQYFELVESAYYPSIPNADENALLTYQSETGNKIFSQALDAAVAAWKLTGDEVWLNKAFRYMEHTKSYLLYRSLKKPSGNERLSLSDSIRLYQGRVNRYNVQIANRQPASFQAWEENQNQLVKLVNKYQRDQLQFKYEQTATIPTLRSIQKILNSNQSIVQYASGQHTIYGLYLDHENIKLFEIGDKETLLSLIKDFKSILYAKNHQQLSLQKRFSIYSNKLYDYLVSPFSSFLEKDQQLIVIPDGELNQLPFGALISEKDSTDTLNFQQLAYLIKEIDVLYTPSWKVFQRNLNHDFNLTNIHNLGLWIDPTVKTSFPDALNNFSTDLNTNVVYSKSKKGNKKNFYVTHEKYDLIHLIMHGNSSSIDRSNNYLVFSELPADNLYGYELARFNFHASLLILAACQSGSGSIEQGEGVFSLTRAFLEVGVSQVISTLWNVNQEATDEITINLYKYLKTKKTPAASLRAAKLDYISSQKNHHLAFPAYWAGLILQK